MVQVYNQTINQASFTRLFTPFVVREYLNLFVCFFREFSTNIDGKFLVNRLGSMNLEHFYAIIRRYCFADNHLFCVSHAFERFMALRVIKESEGMEWFDSVLRRKLQDNLPSLFQWNLNVASEMFTFSEQFFQIVMMIDEIDDDSKYTLPNKISDVLFDLLQCKRDNQSKINDSINIYSISDQSFYNKGVASKARIQTDLIKQFSALSSQNINKSQEQDDIIKTKGKDNRKASDRKEKIKMKIDQTYGSSFETETGSNLCFFNQALQLILHCKWVYEWTIEKSLDKLHLLF